MNEEMYFLVIKNRIDNNNFQSCIANKATLGDISVDLKEDLAQITIVTKYSVNQLELDPNNKLHRDLLLNLEKYTSKEGLVIINITKDIIRIENQKGFSCEIETIVLDEHNNVVHKLY